jgi:ABC-type transport system involved in multi-copper enzyme maturation permease subunit
MSRPANLLTEQRAGLRSRIGIVGAAVTVALLPVSAGFRLSKMVCLSGCCVARRRRSLPFTDWAVAALWTLLLFLGVALAGSTQEKPVTLASQSTSDDADVHPPQVWRASAGAIALCMGGVLAVYFVSCWLGGTSGVNAAWLSRLGATLAMAGGYLLADWGSGALQVALPPEVRGPWRTFRQLWFQGLVLITLLFIGYFAFRGREFSFNDAPIVLLSPWITMISLFRYDITFPPLLPGVAWSMWWPPLVQAAIGLACWTFAHALLQRRGEWAPAAEDEKETFVDKLLWPLRMVGKGLSAAALAVLNGFEALQNFIRRQNDRIADRTIKLFNPVLTDELRRRLHREHWLAQWVLLMISGAIMVYLFGEPRALLAGTTTFADWGLGLVITTLVLSGFLIGFSALLLGKSLDRERANGTLVFLFLTPLTDREIVRGKWLPGLVHAGILLAAALPWLVLGSVVALLGNEFSALWIALGGLLVVVIHWLWVAALSVLFAVRARKPGEGIGKSLVVVFLSYAFTLFIAVWFLRDMPSSEVDALIWPIAGAVGTLFLMLSWAAWRGALSSLKHQRYSDSALRGKGAQLNQFSVRVQP